jgi:hypothetical protein
MELKERLRTLAHDQRTTMQALCERAVWTLVINEETKTNHPPGWWAYTEEERKTCSVANEILRSTQPRARPYSNMLTCLIDMWLTNRLTVLNQRNRRTD